MGAPTHSRVLVLGGGVAGLTVALRLADAGQQVTVLAKRLLTEGSSRYAQGGIAAVMAANDSVADHVEDTRALAAERRPSSSHRMPELRSNGCSTRVSTSRTRAALPICT